MSWVTVQGCHYHILLCCQLVGTLAFWVASTFRVVTSSQSSWKLWRRGSCKDETDETDETTRLSLLGPHHLSYQRVMHPSIMSIPSNCWSLFWKKTRIPCAASFLAPSTNSIDLPALAELPFHKRCLAQRQLAGFQTHVWIWLLNLLFVPFCNLKIISEVGPGFLNQGSLQRAWGHGWSE